MADPTSPHPTIAGDDVQRSRPLPRRPFRFGVQLLDAPTGGAWVEQARRVEDLGYAVATMPDHFDRQWGPIAGLTAVLGATTTLRAGALVLDNDYRHPLVLAKELATIDAFSDGRLEIGLGAGWMTADYEQSGIELDPPGVRIDRFVEGLDVIEGLLGDGPFSYEGEHYTITGHDLHPSPVQRPRPPIVVGGGGRRVLGIAARRADIVGINGNLRSGVIGDAAIATMTLEAVEERLQHVVAVATEAGRVDEIELHLRAFFVAVTEDRDGRIADTADLLGVDPVQIAESPYALIGTTDEIAEQLIERREQLGFSYVTVSASDIDAFAPVVARLAGS